MSFVGDRCDADEVFAFDTEVVFGQMDLEPWPELWGRESFYADQIQSIEYLAAHFGSDLAGYGDVLDLGTNLWNRDFRAAGLSAVGLVPVFGDSVKAIAMLKKFAKLGEPAARAVAEFVTTRLKLSKDEAKKLLDTIFRGVKLRPRLLSAGPRVCSVYAGLSAAGTISYIGISNNIDQRTRQHGDRFEIKPIKGASELTRGACRSIEEALIVEGGFKAAGGALENKVHSIDPNSDDYDELLAYGEKMAGRYAPDLFAASAAA